MATSPSRGTFLDALFNRQNNNTVGTAYTGGASLPSDVSANINRGTELGRETPTQISRSTNTDRNRTKRTRSYKNDILQSGYNQPERQIADDRDYGVTSSTSGQNPRGPIQDVYTRYDRNTTATPTPAPTGSTSAPTSTLTSAPISLQTGRPTAAAEDVAGSKLIEALQSARSGALRDTSNRLADLGYTGGQAAGFLGTVDADFMREISQGLGNFNIDRLKQAEEARKFNEQLALNAELGRGNLALGQNQLALQGELGRGNLALGERGLSIQEALGLGNLSLGQAQLALQEALGMGNLALAQNQFGLQEELGRGQLDLSRLAQAASANQAMLQLELQRELGLTNAGLSAQEMDNQVALRLAELMMTADTASRQQLENLMRTYFGGGTTGSATINVG